MTDYPIERVDVLRATHPQADLLWCSTPDSNVWSSLHDELWDMVYGASTRVRFATGDEVFNEA